MANKSKPISLAPLSFEDAVRKILAAKPPKRTPKAGHKRAPKSAKKRR